MAGDTPEFCFFRVSVAGEVQDRPIVIQLKQQDCPKTCQNFVALCSSKETTSSKRPFPSYRGTYFHRLIEGFMVQGGDFERFDGTGGYSPLFQVFDDENLRGKHDQAGIVSMANAGKNTNKSQFFVSSIDCID
jgi:cyclophilin family peptidyl-prolyl cis-trans isomerase